MTFPYTSMIILTPVEKGILDESKTVTITRSKRYKNHSGYVRDGFKARIAYGKYWNYKPLGYGTVNYQGREDGKFLYDVELERKEEW